MTDPKFLHSSIIHIMGKESNDIENRSENTVLELVNHTIRHFIRR